MKTWKLIYLLFLASILGACDDDKLSYTDIGGGNKENEVGVSFATTEKNALKSAGMILIPVSLEEANSKVVKVRVDIVESSDANAAREGVDFVIENRVVTIPAGSSVGNLQVDLLAGIDNDDDRVLKLRITEIIGGGDISATKNTYTLHLISNSFIQFQGVEWITYEAAKAGGSNAKTLRVPLEVVGSLSEDVVVNIAVTDGSALEYTHFNLVSKQIKITPGEEIFYVDLIMVDDAIENIDRFFTLTLEIVQGGNLVLGSANTTTKVTIVSEEILKTFSFVVDNIDIQEGGSADIVVNLNVPVEQDEENVRVEFGQSAGGNAFIDKDYQLSSKYVEFGAGERSKIVTLYFPRDIKWFVDRKFTLELQSPVGGAVLDGKGMIDVVVANEDVINFDETISFVEDAGDVTFPVSIEVALDEDLVFNVSTVSTGATDGVHYRLRNDEVIIKRGETTADIRLEIGFIDHWPENAGFNIYLNNAEGLVDDLESVATLTHGLYRQVLGEWILKIGEYSVVGQPVQENYTTKMTIMEEKWNETVNITTQLVEGTDMLFKEVVFNRNTGDITWTNKNPFIIMQFADKPNKTAVFLDAQKVNGEDFANKQGIPVLWDAETRTYTWNINNEFGLKADGRLVDDLYASDEVDWYTHRNLSMTKKDID